MPCWTRFETTPMQLGNLPDRGMLARVLTSQGWTVNTIHAGTTGSTAHGKRIRVDQDVITARRGDQALNIRADGSALLRGPKGKVDTDTTTREILQGYAREATLASTARFGFKLASERTLAGNVKELTFVRPTAGTLGKVGL